MRAAVLLALATTLTAPALDLAVAEQGEPTEVIEGEVPPREVVSHFFVPPDNRGSAEIQTVIGNSQPYTIRRGDTFVEISRRFDVGYNELISAHPELDPWVPEAGTHMVIPSEWVLPRSDYEGLIVNIPEMRLYYYVPSPRSGGRSSTVITYPVGLGRQDWRTPQGSFHIRGKTKNPAWVIPESIREERYREQGLSDTMIRGGDPENPLGRHRLELTLPSYAIHGTNKNWGVGMRVSHGCVRMFPEDIAALFPIITIGSPGHFIYQPVKIGLRRGRVMVEVHEDIYGVSPWMWMEAQELVRDMGLTRYVDPKLLEAAVEAQSGVPTDVSYVSWPEDQLEVEPLEFDENGDLVLTDEGAEARAR